MALSREAYTLAEVADVVGPVTVRTVYNWVNRAGLKVTKIAGRPMVLRVDLEAFLTQSKPSDPA